MFVIIAPIQIKEGHREEFIEAMLDDAIGSVRDEPGCLRFDVIQDGADENRIWLYEVYVDEDAFKAHMETPHFIKWRDTVKDWFAENEYKGAGGGSSILYPPDEEWK
ncbi:antibiotic biosynthesis monooxygenase [Candidatus Poribacteria bacterium]|nr:antibiotic biosynthesis monooxygenase [Candidatus Poribacteria bacterium]